MAKWNQVLVAMTFTNDCERFKLVVACLMACINGATMPVFSIIFTEMLTIFFSCFPLPLGVPLPPSTENFLAVCSGATGNPFWGVGAGANQSIFVYVCCCSIIFVCEFSVFFCRPVGRGRQGGVG